jgi:hypothetical protein
VKTSSEIKAGKWVAALCFGLVAIRIQAAQFVEIRAEMEIFGYQLANTDSIASAKPRTVHVWCIAGVNEWYIESDFQHRQVWLFTGTNLLYRSWPKDSKVVREAWESSDGYSGGDYGVHIPWLAFCSGTYLKRPGRLVPLMAGQLAHCPDQFAYTDATTTFPDDLGLPRSLDLFSSHELFLKSHTDWDKKLSFGDRYTDWNEKTASKIQDGVLLFHYAVLDSTNGFGWTVPTKFEFFQIGRQYEENGNWFCQGTGRVKSVRPATKLPALE